MSLSNFENYFKYKKDKNYSFEEYVVWNLYLRNFRVPFTQRDKNRFFSSYNNYFKKYKNEDKCQKLSDVSTLFFIFIF